MKISWEDIANINCRTRRIEDNLMITKSRIYDIGNKIEELLENKVVDIAKEHKLVVIYDGIRDCKIYKEGKDITAEVKKLTFEGGEYPEIIIGVVNNEKD